MPKNILISLKTAVPVCIIADLKDQWLDKKKNSKMNFRTYLDYYFLLSADVKLTLGALNIADPNK